MQNGSASDDDIDDPLAFETDFNNIVDDNLMPEIHLDAATRCMKFRQPLRRSRSQPNIEPKSKIPSSEDEVAEEVVDPLFPITKKMCERIKRMKQRMLITLKLSEEQLVERREKRKRQTRESRQRSAKADADFRHKVSVKQLARSKAQRELLTPEQIERRLVQKREQGRRYFDKRRETETAEQKKARREYQRLYMRSRQPVKFV